MCESVPPLSEPLCVAVCQPGCLTYAERQLETQAHAQALQDAVQRGLESLLNKYGAAAVIRRLNRTSR